jgi:hypothetical protein
LHPPVPQAPLFLQPPTFSPLAVPHAHPITKNLLQRQRVTV